MKLLDAAGLLVGAIDTLWSLADDFAPSATLREAAALAREVRESLFDQEATKQETLLKARIEAVRQAHLATAAYASGASSASATDLATVGRLQQRMDLLFSLLDVGPREHDVFAGNLGERGNAPASGFVPLGEHAGTAAVASAALKRAAAGAFGTRSKQHEQTERRARLEERLRLLATMDAHLAEAVPSTTAESATAAQATTSVLDAHFDATRFALRAVDARFAGARPRRQRHASVAARAAVANASQAPTQPVTAPKPLPAVLNSPATRNARRRINIG